MEIEQLDAEEATISSRQMILQDHGLDKYA
jgi:hypothetical protein